MDKDKALAELLIEGDERRLSDLHDEHIPHLKALLGFVRLFGQDGDGHDRLPITRGIVEDHLSLVTSVGARRAELVGEVVKHEHWKPRPGDREWHPDHGLYERRHGGDGDGPTGLD